MAAKEEIGAVVIGTTLPDSVATWQLIQGEFTRVPVALIQDLEDTWPTGIRYTHRFAKNLLPEEQASDLWPLPMSAPPRAMPANRWLPGSYHGALLLSQRLPILIPDNFIDGTSAAFFDSPEEMVEKAQDLLTHPATLARIASAGRRLALEKHTAGARARYVLEKLGLAVPAGPLGRRATGSGRVPAR